MSTEIRFASFNCGSGWADYKGMVSASEAESKALQQELGPMNSPEEFSAATKKRMEQIETIVADKLADSQDVICLQELKDPNRPFVKKLEEKGFHIFRLEQNDPQADKSNLENVVAIRRKLFDEGVIKSADNISIPSESHPIRGRPSYGQQIAATIVRLKSGVTLSFTSLYNWGFPLYPQDLPEEMKQRFEDDTAAMEYGLTYTEEAVENVKKHHVDFAVISGDINNNPENDERPFKYLEASRFKVHEPDQPTNINAADLNRYNERKIDFIFTSVQPSQPWYKKIGSAFRSIFFSSVSIEITEPKVLEGYDFTRNTNCSDHKPLGMTIKVIETTPKSQRLWNWMRGVK